MTIEEENNDLKDQIEGMFDYIYALEQENKILRERLTSQFWDDEVARERAERLDYLERERSGEDMGR